MKLKQFVLDYLSYNRAEQRGLVILAAILLGMIMATRLLPSGEEDSRLDISSFEREVRNFRNALAAAQKEEPSHEPGRRSGHYGAGAFTTRGDSGIRRMPRSTVTFTIELNSTDTLELQRLRGIGPGYARRIIWYRQRLGGYLSPDQLKEIEGLDEARFAAIRDYLTVNSDSVRKIGLNQAAFKEFLRHPYFPYQLTKEIILYRKKIKSFRSIEELRQVAGVNDSVFNKIKEYVEVR